MEEPCTVKYSKEILERYRELFKDLDSFLEANEKENLCIRVNTLKISKEDLKKRLERRGVILEEIRYGFTVVDAPFAISSCPEHLLGYFYIQGEAEMNVVPFFDPGSRVIDMCAAPGGKTTQIAELMRNHGVILAFDVAKIAALKNNVQRMGVENCVTYKKDATTLDISAPQILLDAPCTGSGIIRKDPTRKRSRTMEDIFFCQRLQKRLLASGIAALEEGGELIYCTCSFEPEENEYVIDWVLKRFDITLEEITTAVNGKPLVDGFRRPFGTRLDPAVKKCKRFLPHIHDTHGIFVAKVVK
jgi:NOL1/NOP2/sun family putative RNA methylase